MNWEYLREEEFDDAIARSKGVCVIPLGCLEKHGQHLPMGTDSLKAIGLVEDAAAIEEVTIFPAGLWLGDVCGFHADPYPEKHRSRGGIGINPQTLLTILEELCDEIARNGYRKILILSSHGGNTGLLTFFTRAQQYKNKNYAVVWASATDSKIHAPENMYPIVLERREEFPYLTDEDMEALRKFAETGTGGGHADWKETALMMHYHPQTVAPDRFDAENGLSTHRADHLMAAGFKNTMLWSMNYPNAFSGYPPVGCTANIGRAMAQLLVERLVTMFRTLKEDDVLLAHVDKRCKARQPK